jgi:hypothetical protein
MKGLLLFPTASVPAMGTTQSPIRWGMSAPSRGVKKPGRQPDHASLSSADVMNAWSYTGCIQKFPD